ncbi:MAG: putative metal-binding motif-containing protein, partial [Myxococcales bacterium]|nr:putative metal-binding motif-containing protein [Myxococcales bacterium]
MTRRALTLLSLASWLALGCSEAMPMDPDAAGGVDAAIAMDSAVPPMDATTPVCTTDVDCADGLFCNGAETCVAGACQPGAAPDCDDGVACTLDSCSEDDGECVNAPPDSDGDGVADATCRDADGLALGIDCDDADPNRYPGNPEVCDADDHDEDCDPLTFGVEDLDGDGHISDRCCNVAPDGTRACGDDCIDADQPFVFRGAPELCDGLDNDCNGLTDDDIRSRTFGIDCDGDRFGVPTDPPIVDCALPTDPIACPGGVWVPDATDCDDTNASRNPGLVEVCDGIDNNCDPAGAIDEGVLDVDYYPDCDNDSHGDASAAPRTDCTFPSTPPPCAGGGWATSSNDCDDTDPRRHGGRPEVCDGIDNDCDPMELADDGLTFFDYYADCDLDSHGDASGTANRSCLFPVSPPSCGGSWVRGNDDCDDTEFARNPGRPEICDGLDNDCDPSMLVDDGLTFVDYYPDCDADGYGDDAATAASLCAFPAAAPACAGGVWATNANDCDDGDATRNPGRTEVCDGRDNNCDPAGAVDEGLPIQSYYPDCDGDRFGRDVVATRGCSAPTTVPLACPSGGWATNASDCDDTDGTRNPTAPEVCNGADTDCNTLVDDVIAGSEICSPGDSQSCLTACVTPGTQGCAGCVGWSTCRGPEICNGCDDDASGAPEGPLDGFACAAGVSTETCRVDACGTSGTRVCNATCDWDPCRATELCNYCDDDADGSFDEEYAVATRDASVGTTYCGSGEGNIYGAATCLFAMGSPSNMFVVLLDGSSMNQTGAYWWTPADLTQGWGPTSFAVDVELSKTGPPGDVAQPLGGWSLVVARSGGGTFGPPELGGVPSSFTGISVSRLWNNRTGGDCDPAGTPPSEGDVLRVTHDGDLRVVGGGSTPPCGDGEDLAGTTGDFGSAPGGVTQRMQLTYVPDNTTTPGVNEEQLTVVANGVTMVYRGADIGPLSLDGDLPIGAGPLQIGIIASVYSATGFGATPTDVYGIPVRAQVHLFRVPSGPVVPSIVATTQDLCP